MTKLDDVVDVVVPEVGIGKAVLKWVGIAIAGIIVLAVLGWLVWKVGFAERAAETKHDAVQLQATQGLGTAAAASGHEAVQITVDNSKAAAGIDAAVKGALNEIAKAKGADADIDAAVDDVGRRAICLRASAASLPECQPLQRVGP